MEIYISDPTNLQLLRRMEAPPKAIGIYLTWLRKVQYPLPDINTTSFAIILQIISACNNNESAVESGSPGIFFVLKQKDHQR